MMELRHLRAFVAIAEEGNITRAALRLRMSQPALSRVLQQLERHHGIGLVDRSTHHLRLTGAGRRFESLARRAVDAADTALDPARLAEGPLRIGYAYAALGRQTTALLRRWADDHPEAPLELVHDELPEQGLVGGRVDAFLCRNGTRARDLRRARIAEESRVVAVPVDDELSGRRRVHLADLVDRVVAVNPVSGSTSAELWADHDRPPRTTTVLTVQQWLTAVAGGRAVGVTSRATADLHAFPGVVYLPIADGPPVHLEIISNDPPTHPLVDAFVALAQEVAGDPNPPADFAHSPHA